eukprot:1669688-Prymnesium_polylepis.1
MCQTADCRVSERTRYTACHKHNVSSLYGCTRTAAARERPDRTRGGGGAGTATVRRQAGLPAATWRTPTRRRTESAETRGRADAGRQANAGGAGM